MRLEAKKYLFDVLEAANLASEFVAGRSFEDYRDSPMVRFAVERAFTIIGEAMSHLARVDVVTAEQVGDFRTIIAFRNILVHAYAQLDDRIVWGILESKVPDLVIEVSSLLKESSDPT